MRRKKTKNDAGMMLKRSLEEAPSTTTAPAEAKPEADAPTNAKSDANTQTDAATPWMLPNILSRLLYKPGFENVFLGAQVRVHADSLEREGIRLGQEGFIVQISRDKEHGIVYLVSLEVTFLNREFYASALELVELDS